MRTDCFLFSPPCQLYCCGVIREAFSFFPFLSLPFLFFSFFLDIQQALLKGESILRTSEPSGLSSSPERKSCILSGLTSCSCQCRTCHIVKPNRPNISLPTPPSLIFILLSSLGMSGSVCVSLHACQPHWP